MDAADFDIVLPAAELAPFVRRYIYAKCGFSDPLAIRVKPTGYIYFANCFRVLRGDGAVVDGCRTPRRSRWNFLGQVIDHDVVVEHARHSGWIACELTATAFHRMFGVPGVHVTGAVMPLREVRPDMERLASTSFVSSWRASREVHVAEADCFFTDLAERSGAPDPVVEQAVAIFEDTNGAVRVADVCKALGVSSRQLVRRFTNVVGVGPKYFGQILQINWVVGLLYSDDKASLTAMAHAAGFYDQAHFNHAMHRFFSEGPTDFLKSDHVAFRTFLGASRRFGPASPTNWN